MVTRVTERALKPESVTSNQPLNFEFYYGESAAPTEMNTVYLDDGNDKLELNLQVFNESSKTITFVPASSSNSSQARFDPVGSPNSANEANEARCHFSLTFAIDLNINAEEILLKEEQKNDWQVNYDKDSQFMTLYFLRKERLVLPAKNPENNSDSILLTFTDFAARNRLVKTSNVKLTYGSELLLDGQDRPFTRSITVNNAISVTNHPENKNIPLQVRCVGPNTVLNDGTSRNTLKLQIINRSLSTNRPNLLLDKKTSQFIVRFETGNGAEALTTRDKVNGTNNVNNINNLNNTSVTATDTTNWNVQKTPNEAEWTVKLQDDSKKTKLADKDTIELEISNLVTSNPSGVAYLYITYQNIGCYPDGQLLLPIEKTPLLYRGAQVGIGTISPSEKLEVSGNIKVTGAIQPSAGNTEKNGIMFPKDPGGGANDAAWIRYYARTGEACTLEIGINNDATDHIALIPGQGNVGIGINDPSAKLHVAGNAIVSGKLAIRTTIPETSTTNIDLAIGDQDTGLKQEGENKLAIYTNNAERVRIDENGNVGIGTTELLAKLHVDGGNAIFMEGRVGIGTNSPRSKLEIMETASQQKTDFICIYNFAQGEAQESRIVWRNGPPPHEKYAAAIASQPGVMYNSGNLKFQTASNGTLTDKMIIQADGKVGIGTTTPSAKLDVNGSVKLGDGSTEWNRIICGKVIINYDNISQSKVYGTGIKSCSLFNYSNTLPLPFMGRCKITFEKLVDPDKLVVILTPQDKDKDNIINVESVERDGFIIQVKDSKNQVIEYSSFHFIAIELTDNSSKSVIMSNMV